jgi:hypothetical protein
MIIIIQGYGQDNQGFEFREVQETFLFSKIPDRPWGPPSLLYRVFPGGKAAAAW